MADIDRNNQAKTLRDTVRDTDGFGDSLSASRWGTARFNQQTRLALHVATTGDIIVVDIPVTTGVFLGRTDPATNWVPDVDLTHYDARKLGVSRKHARLDVFRDRLYITDMGSGNGTYLSEEQIGCGKSQFLRDGDALFLGKLKLLIYFVTATDSTE